MKFRILNLDSKAEENPAFLILLAIKGEISAATENPALVKPKISAHKSGN